MRIFLNMGIVEHTGHGIPTILKRYGREAFEIRENFIKVIIPFDKKVLEQQNVGLNVGLNLTYSEDSVVKILLEKPNSTAETISNDLALSKRTIERILSSLQVKGVIERIGSKKMGRWKVVK